MLDARYSLHVIKKNMVLFTRYLIFDARYSLYVVYCHTDATIIVFDCDEFSQNTTAQTLK